MRRQIYFWVSVVGMPVEVTNWVLKLMRESDDLGTLYFNPVFFVMSAWIVVWLARGGSATVVERTALLVVAVAVLFRLVVAPLTAPEAILQNLQDTYWLIVLLSIVTFLVFEYRRSVLASAALYGLGVSVPWWLLARSDLIASVGNRLLQVQLLAGMVLIAMYSLAWYREHFTLEQQRLRITEKLAHSDALTGLPNRHALYPHLAEQIAAAQQGQTACVLLIDLDHFKMINDRHGHLTGDAVLVEVAQHLQRLLPDTGMVGRWGGEEFLVVLPHTPLPAAVSLAEQLCRHLAGQRFAEDVPVTISIGVSECRPGDSAAGCLTRADWALYQAKHAGRNRVCCTDADDPGSVSARPELRSPLG